MDLHHEMHNTTIHSTKSPIPLRLETTDQKESVDLQSSQTRLVRLPMQLHDERSKVTSEIDANTRAIA